MGSSDTYIFSWSVLFYGFAIGFIVCTSSWIVTSAIKNRIFKNGYVDISSAVRFIGWNLGVALVTFTVMYLVINGKIYLVHYTVFFTLTIAVVTIENLIYLLYCTMKNRQELQHELSTHEQTTILVATGNKHTPVDMEDISFAQLQNGIIMLETSKGPVVTQYASLDELEQLLPPKQFFRANRQVILHRKVIKEIRKGMNRKLHLIVNGEIPEKEISVSRYKRKDLMNWIATEV